jgi:hypothetical protein
VNHSYHNFLLQMARSIRLSEVHTGLISEPEAPVRRRDVVSEDGLFGGVGCELEAERLSSELRERLVRGAPVVAHADPPGAAAALHPHLADVTGAGHVHHVRQQPVRVPLQREPDAALPHAGHPAVHDGHDASAPEGHLHEGRFGEVEVGARRVAPAAVVGVLRPVGRAQVGRRHRDHRRAPVAPRRAHAPHLVARPATVPVLEQRRAQRRRVRAVPSGVQVAVPARATCKKKSRNLLSKCQEENGCVCQLARQCQTANATHPWSLPRSHRRRTWRAPESTASP